MRLLGVRNDRRHGRRINKIVPYMGVLHRGEHLYWIVHTPRLSVGDWQGNSGDKGLRFLKAR